MRFNSSILASAGFEVLVVEVLTNVRGRVVSTKWSASRRIAVIKSRSWGWFEVEKLGFCEGSEASLELELSALRFRMLGLAGGGRFAKAV